METGDNSQTSLWAAVLDRAVERRRRVRSLGRALAEPQGTDLSERDRAALVGILAKLDARARTDLRGAVLEALKDAGDGSSPAMENDRSPVAALRADGSLFERDDLVELALYRWQSHRLSNRLRGASEGDTLEALLGSPVPSVAEATRAYLVDEARRVDSYQDPLLRLSDLEADQRLALLWHAAATLRLDWPGASALDPAALDQALEAGVGLLAEAARGAAAQRPAVVLASSLGAEGSWDPDMMVRLLRGGEVALFEAIFGARTGLDPLSVQRLVFDPNPADFALACQAAGFGPETIEALGEIVGAAAPDPAPESDARRILEYWRRNPAYRQAVEMAAARRSATDKD